MYGIGLSITAIAIVALGYVYFSDKKKMHRYKSYT